MFHDAEQNRRHYDRVSESKTSLYFERFDTHLLKDRPLVASLLDKAFDAVFPERVGALLDVGCGTGFYFPLLSRHAESITGIDLSTAMLAEAEHLIAEENLSNCRVVAGSALDLPFADESMDVVHSWDFLHHLSNLPRGLAEIQRVLKPGGRYIAFEPNILNPSITWYHFRRRSEWRLFIQNQFSIPRQLRKDFDVCIKYDNTIISFLNERTLWIWKLANRITSLPCLGILSFRYVIECRKRSGPER